MIKPSPEARTSPERILSLAGDSLGEVDRAAWDRIVALFPPAIGLAPFYEAKNGWLLFESSFLCLPTSPVGRIPGMADFETWAEWAADEACPAHGKLPFAVNALGELFVISDAGIEHVDLASELVLFQFRDLDHFCQALLDDYPLHTGYDLVHRWQIERGALPPEKILQAVTPFMMGGAYEVENLKATDRVELLNFYHYLGTQMRGVPDGTVVRFKIVP